MIYWHAITAFVLQNKAVLWLLATAGIITLPEPGKKFSLYTWLYDWAHQFSNLRRPTNQNSQQQP